MFVKAKPALESAFTSHVSFSLMFQKSISSCRKDPHLNGTGGLLGLDLSALDTLGGGL